MTRDQAPRNIYITCVAEGSAADYLLRLDQGGALLGAWSVEGLGIAVTPNGTAAFVVSHDQTSLIRYELAPPG